GVSDDPDRRILSSHLYADGRFAEELWLDGRSAARHPPLTVEDIEQGRLFPHMNGRKVFKHAVTRMPEVALEALAANGFGIEDVDLLVCHQANLRINEFVQQSLGIPPEKVHNNIQRYGNTTAASIPLCFDEARREGKVKPGDLVLFVAFGAGFTWGANLLRY
ncbi:MAG: 3-oxoacyl-ACP synthase, partial [Acidobacteria bacterium]